MPFLVILKRFEVWLLLGLVAALLAFAFLPEPPPSPALPEKPDVLTNAPHPDKTPVPISDYGAPAVESRERLSVRGVKVLESPGGYIVETILEGRSPTGADLVLDEKAVTATTGSGEPVSRFFEPFAETASLPSGEDSLATLRWWLPRPAESLALEIKGISLAVDLP